MENLGCPEEEPCADAPPMSPLCACCIAGAEEEEGKLMAVAGECEGVSPRSVSRPGDCSMVCARAAMRTCE